MDLTAGTKATATLAAVVMAVGLTVILYGVGQNDLTWVLGGACLAVPALVLVALVAIKSWITDTREERRLLTEAIREMQGERTRYIALRAALENEQSRLHRDLAHERARSAAKLFAEREAVAAEFEEKRNRLISEAMTEAWMMFLSGKQPQTAENKVIQFPTQQPAPQRAAERCREHGVVGP